jgi:hypothetical protein
MTKPSSSDERQAPQPERRQYSTPRLTEYGPISKLTRTGKGSTLEGTTPLSMAPPCL